MKLVNKTKINDILVYVIDAASERQYRVLKNLFNIEVVDTKDTHQYRPTEEITKKVIFTTRGDEALLDKFLKWTSEDKVFSFDHITISTKNLMLEYQLFGTDESTRRKLPLKAIKAILQGESHYQIRKLLQGEQNG